MEQPLRIPPDTVARPDGGAAIGRRIRRRPEPFGSALRILPVPLRDERTAMHQFALFLRVGHRALIVDDEDFRERDRLAHRGRMAVDKVRVEIGRTECLGQSVHREQPRFGEQGPQVAYQFDREGSPAVGQAAHGCQRLGRPLHFGQLDPERRDGGQRGDAVPGAGLRDVTREKVVERDHTTARVPSRKQLVLPVVETERQDCKRDVIAAHPQIIGHRDGTQPEVRMAEHDALGLARRTAGIENCRQRTGIAVRRPQAGGGGLGA